VQIRIAFGRRDFAPSWFMTGVTVLLLVLFIVLGRWQWGRGESKQRLLEQFQSGTVGATDLGARGSRELPRFQRVRVTGQWQAQQQFLLDNRTRDGRAGYEVLTPLALRDGRVLLVNRGWVPFLGYRDRLPDVMAGFSAESRAVAAAGARADDGAETSVTGRLDELPSPGLAGGRAAPARDGRWPRVTAYPRSEELAAALAVADGSAPRLEPRVLLLDAGEPRGFVRDWQPPGQPPATHWSYAVQWWSFGVLLLVLYVTLNTKKVR
jgi:surfeit locus 1 family protein